MIMPIYLSSDEAADYLRIKPRKLYELAAMGALPCSKVTGKWLFPRAALDRWIASGLASPDGSRADPPPIVGGSHDPLLEWVLRRCGCGLALLPEGSEAGLARLAEDAVAIAAIHLHAPQPTTDANVEAVRSRPGLHDVVVITFALREQGLVTASPHAGTPRDLAAAVGAGARFALRQPGAGARLLLDALLARAGLDPAGLVTAGVYPTGNDLALAIRGGEADCGIATRAVATLHGLGFVSLVWERFDLVMRRRTAFEPGPQALFVAMRTAGFAARADAFGGYELAPSGRVVLNA